MEQTYRDKERIGSGLPEERDSVKRQGVDGGSKPKGIYIVLFTVPRSGGAKRTGSAPHKNPRETDYSNLT